MSTKKIAVIGGGAAGFFGAVNCARLYPNTEVLLLEKGNKLLSKVKVSGGGRCNVTNACNINNQLAKNYPRGGKELKTLFNKFSVPDTIEWFESRGVKLKTESDGRMFPISDSSQSIVDCLINEAEEAGVKIMTGMRVKKINPIAEKFKIELLEGEPVECDKILIASGGSSSLASYDWLAAMGHDIIPPVPSLFTFNIPDSPFKDLLGVSVGNANVKITGIKQGQSGPLLITHWGLSGPAVLKLSAWEARALYDVNYNFTISVNWIPDFDEEKLRAHLLEFKEIHSKKTITSNPLFGLARRLWERLTELAEIPAGIRWLDLSKKHMNKLIEMLIRTPFTVKGKTTFKEEFVTCGGVALKDIDLNTMESMKCPGIYFAGEILDIDGVTGGFNFQAAWTTAWVAARGMGL